MDHKLQKFGNGHYRCNVCTKTWMGKPRSACAGITVYERDQPEYLLKKDELFGRGLRLADDQMPVAMTGYGTNLYDVRQWDRLNARYEAEFPKDFTLWTPAHDRLSSELINQMNGLEIALGY